MMQKTKIKKNSAFTLVETLVAIAILSISVLSASLAVQSGLSESYYASDEVTAYYLIQEAVEYIRNIRDSNALANISSLSSGGAGVNWLTGISAAPTDPCYFGETCQIDVPLNKMTDCHSPILAGACTYLNQNGGSGLFGYTAGAGWTTTKFKRALQISQVNANEIVLTVLVSWKDSGNKTGSVSVPEWLFNTR